MRRLLQNGTSLLFRRQTHILSAALVIMFTFGLSHLAGLVRTRLLLSQFFGSQAQLLDVYYAAFALPDIIFQLLVIGSLSASFIPVFTRLLSKDERAAWHLANSTLNLVLLIFSAASAVLFLFSLPLSRLIAPGFSPSQILLLSQLLRLVLIAQLFFCISGFFTAMIQSHQRFLIPALAPVLYNLGIITFLVLLSSRLGIFAPALGAVAGSIAHMLIQLPLAFRLGFRPDFSLDFRHPGVREIIRLMPPRALALGIDQIEQLVSVILASTLAAGSLSLLNIARLLYLLPASLFGISIGQAALPSLSRASQEDKRQFARTLTDTLLQVAFLALPVSVLFIVLRIPVVRIIFGSKTFPWPATLLTGKTLGILAISAAPAALMPLISRGFYALHDTSTPLKIGLVAAILGSLAAFISVSILDMGLLGLAAVISAVTILETLCLFFMLFKRLSPSSHPGRFLLYKITLPLAKMLITTVITGISLWIPMRFLDRFVFDTTRTLSLLILTGVTSLIGLSVYIFLSYLFRVDELRSFLALALRLRQWPRLLLPPRSSEPLIPPADSDS